MIADSNFEINANSYMNRESMLNINVQSDERDNFFLTRGITFSWSAMFNQNFLLGAAMFNIY
jgi:hypothetical protein